MRGKGSEKRTELRGKGSEKRTEVIGIRSDRKREKEEDRGEIRRQTFEERKVKGRFKSGKEQCALPYDMIELLYSPHSWLALEHTTSRDHLMANQRHTSNFSELKSYLLCNKRPMTATTAVVGRDCHL